MEYSDLYTSFCSGLLSGVARRNDTNELISAADAHKSLTEYYCPECFSTAVVRKCVDKRDHFAHKAAVSKVYAAGESQLHKQCKNEICEALKEIFPTGKWEVERRVEANTDKGLELVIPDISGRLKDGTPVIIEVQRSYLNLRTIKKRTKEYTVRNAHILRIIPLKSALPDNFRPRLFELFLHTFYRGKVFYWQKGFGCNVEGVHYAKTERTIPHTSFYNSMGDEETFGGYTKTYRTIRKGISGGKFNIGTDFIASNQKLFIVNHRNKSLKDVPERKILLQKGKSWWDDSVYNIDEDFKELVTGMNYDEELV